MARRVLPPPVSAVRIRYVPMTPAREPRTRRALELLLRMGSTSSPVPAST